MGCQCLLIDQYQSRPQYLYWVWDHPIPLSKAFQAISTVHGLEPELRNIPVRRSLTLAPDKTSLPSNVCLLSSSTSVWLAMLAPCRIAVSAIAMHIRASSCWPVTVKYLRTAINMHHYHPRSEAATVISRVCLCVCLCLFLSVSTQWLPESSTISPSLRYTGGNNAVSCYIQAVQFRRIISDCNSEPQFVSFIHN